VRDTIGLLTLAWALKTTSILRLCLWVWKEIEEGFRKKEKKEEAKIDDFGMKEFWRIHFFNNTIFFNLEELKICIQQVFRGL
jgi:hypothetical protein